MTYKFIIKEEQIKSRPDLRLYTGNTGTYVFQFEFDENWDGLLLFASFISSEGAYVVKIENNMATVPQELLLKPGSCHFGVYGTDSLNEVKRMSSNLVCFEVEQGAYSDGTTPEIPTPDIWETLLYNSIPVIRDKKWYIYDITTKEYKDTGICAEGKAPEKGVDYFTAEDILSLGLEEKANKVISISENPTDESYPSEKAVKDYVDNFVPNIDVQINGNTIVEDGVANIPLMSTSQVGVGKVVHDGGLYNYGSDGLYVKTCGSPHIDKREEDLIRGFSTKDNNANLRFPVSPAVLDYAVKAAMCDGKGAAWSPSEQAAARARMGAEKEKHWTLVGSVTTEEDIAVINFTELIPKDKDVMGVGFKFWNLSTTGVKGMGIRPFINYYNDMALGNVISDAEHPSMGCYYCTVVNKNMICEAGIGNPSSNHGYWWQTNPFKEYDKITSADFRVQNGNIVAGATVDFYILD